MPEQFVVEKVLAQRVRDNTTEVFVKWKGYPSSENTWEPWAGVNHTKAYWVWQEGHEGVIEKILDKRLKDGQMKCQVKWQNQVETEWVPYENNLDDTIAYEEYMEKAKLKKEKSKVKKEPVVKLQKKSRKKRKKPFTDSSIQNKRVKVNGGGSHLDDDEVIKLENKKATKGEQKKNTKQVLSKPQIKVEYSATHPEKKKLDKPPDFHPLCPFPHAPASDEEILDIFSDSSDDDNVQVDW